MTKVEQLINSYYRTEGMSLLDHLNATIEESSDNGEIISELCSLLHFLNKEVN